MENKALERWRRNRKKGSLRRAMLREMRILLQKDPEYLASVLPPSSKVQA